MIRSYCSTVESNLFKKIVISNMKMFTSPSIVVDPEAPGNRHDNDKDNISHIAIIPTKNKIRSDSPEFLPYPLRSRKHSL